MVDDATFTRESSAMLPGLYRLSMSILHAQADAQDAVQQGLFDSFTRWQNAGAKEEDRWGMLDTDDVVYLTKEEAEALEAAIHAFSAAHSAPRPGAAPIRYNLIAYRAERADEN